MEKQNLNKINKGYKDELHNEIKSLKINKCDSYAKFN